LRPRSHRPRTDRHHIPRPRTGYPGRHELGQNFLTHLPTLQLLTALVAETEGAILEIGAGDGALTTHLARLGRPLRAIDVDEQRLARLRARLPDVDVRTGDALRDAFEQPVVVGNIPFHLTTPILRRLLDSSRWKRAILLTQWEVARKRAAVGGATMMTAQAAPWFDFTLHGRVPARHFQPMPAVDGGILSVRRRGSMLVELHHRRRYESFVAAVFRSRAMGCAASSGRSAIRRSTSTAPCPSPASPTRRCRGRSRPSSGRRCGCG